MQDVKQRLKELSKQWTKLKTITYKGQAYWADVDHVRKHLVVMYHFRFKDMNKAQQGQMIKLEHQLGFISGKSRLEIYRKMRAEIGLN